MHPIGHPTCSFWFFMLCRAAACSCPMQLSLLPGNLNITELLAQIAVKAGPSDA